MEQVEKTPEAITAACELARADEEICRLAILFKEDGGTAICMMTIGGRLLDLLGVIKHEP